ncbi:hypothetical protein HH219_16680 [Pseudoalteromonas sp. NEC-BIFX-2020_015]|uniref:hypothetical protein n=1 Tax=Pseudoalteromonas sp. NEC-BIFX-2020_015 TaxID=2729544 RepID=UPI0014614299|nr:hypothetical protein [Pseudoalteromonas sp. NEC-BIFX-2020_015]NMR27147.1 hypothetical protein [Pseudoalteromonas sp. NEC-BIFX-2020_015]
MNYQNAQLSYMQNVHISDTNLCEDAWKISLYAPLQKQLSKSLASQPCKNSFVYIGCGPLAPIIEKGTPCFSEIEKYNRIILLDISETYLLQAKKRLSKLFPDKDISFHTYDITNGLSEVFYNLITSLFNGNSSTFLDRVEYLNSNFEEIINRLSPDINFPPIVGASYIYSELVATYTGIPALFDCESELSKNTENVELLLAHIFPLWQIYNERIFSYHLSDLGRMLAAKGKISVATDVEKIYCQNNCDDIASFRKVDYPITSSIEGVSIKSFDQEIMWDDSGQHKYNQSVHLNTLAHVHRVGFYSYEKA